jgi:hypothetical protein
MKGAVIKSVICRTTEEIDEVKKISLMIETDKGTITITAHNKYNGYINRSVLTKGSDTTIVEI